MKDISRKETLHPEIKRQLKIRGINYFYDAGGIGIDGKVMSVKALFLAVSEDDPVLHSDFLNSFCSILGGSLFP